MAEQLSEVRDGMRIDWDVIIPVEDGHLVADVFRPDDDQPHPVLLASGPYAKGLAFADGYSHQWTSLVRDHPEVLDGSTGSYQVWEYPDPERWVPHGYVCVRVDTRGTGASPGEVDFFSPQETRDLFTCVEWAGTQPWSSGKVGMLGISYLASNQWQVAALRPPHLVAICPRSPSQRCRVRTGAGWACTPAATSRRSPRWPRTRSGSKCTVWSIGPSSTPTTASRCSTASSTGSSKTPTTVGIALRACNSKSAPQKGLSAATSMSGLWRAPAGHGSTSTLPAADSPKPNPGGQHRHRLRPDTTRSCSAPRHWPSHQRSPDRRH